MAGMIKATSMLLMAVMLVASVIPESEAGIGCSTVVSYLNPCISYLSGGPLGGCCSGVKRLYGAAGTVQDRQSVCSCLKAISGEYKVLPDRASSLPGQCGVNIPYKISPSIDCSTVH